MSKLKSFNLGELEKLLEGKLVGNPDFLVDNLATLKNSNSTSITFITNNRYKSALKNCSANALIVSKNFEIQDKKNYLVFKDPYLAYAKLTKIFKYNDILFNIFACIYVNIFTHKQPFTVFVTLLSAFSFLTNKKYDTTIIHILLVQWPLCLLLYIYEFPEHDNLINYNNYCKAKAANGSL